MHTLAVIAIGCGLLAVCIAAARLGVLASVVYLVWALVILLKYPLRRWYAVLRQRRNNPWLSDR